MRRRWCSPTTPTAGPTCSARRPSAARGRAGTTPTSPTTSCRPCARPASPRTSSTRCSSAIRARSSRAPRVADLAITLTCADYARVMPLATGEVTPAGIQLTLALGSRGSWPARAEMLRRAVQDPAVHGREWSMAQYLYCVDKGDRRFVGLPVFPLRNFTARDLYVRRGGPVRKPADLVGRRVGMYSYTASGSIWYRHFLRFVG